MRTGPSVVIERDAPSFAGAIKLTPITIEVPAKVHARLAEMAQKVGHPPALYAATLLMAAYAARTKGETGDRDLDDCVSRVVVLDALNDVSLDDIAAYVGLKVETVGGVIDLWRQELAGRAAPRLEPEPEPVTAPDLEPRARQAARKARSKRLGVAHG